MTPTLLGRWQTRVILMSTVGVFISLFFALPAGRFFLTPFIILALATCFGLGWDVLYTWLQKLRWDRDWPPIFFVFGGIVEAIFLWTFIEIIPIPGVDPRLSIFQFVLHYSVVWLTAFALMLGPLRTMLLHWRFQGAEWWKRI